MNQSVRKLGARKSREGCMKNQGQNSIIDSIERKTRFNLQITSEIRSLFLGFSTGSLGTTTPSVE
jgi:hypothetical protein